MAVNIYTIAKSRGVQENDDGGITMGEFERVGLPFFAGCEWCGASLGPVQSYPSKSGFIRCHDCVGDEGFESPEDFESWYGDESTEPEDE